MFENKAHFEKVKLFFMNEHFTEEEKIDLLVKENPNILKEFATYASKINLNNESFWSISEPLTPLFGPFNFGNKSGFFNETTSIDPNLIQSFELINEEEVVINEKHQTSIEKSKKIDQITSREKLIKTMQKEENYFPKFGELIELLQVLENRIDTLISDFNEVNIECKLVKFVDKLEHKETVYEEINKEFKQILNKGYKKEFLYILENICAGYYLSFLKIEAKNIRPKIKFEDYVKQKCKNFTIKDRKTIDSYIKLYAIYCRLPAFALLVNPTDKYNQTFFYRHGSNFLEILETRGFRINSINEKKLPDSYLNALPPINEDLSYAFSNVLDKKRKRN